ncbi:TrmB family transcriptional regulator [Pseudalkalibacillus hwajinpoensis]|uniref:TrmB family transcriptional regulator n=1 Tax=Guptibacillus hwajinpoensis TaxID=208199 RepID=A0A4U1MFF3_9BACL|nr:TrmB family transcriptional regulator [Pseudalkalibacillus hwajinpoensis]TKD69959.1 TrmB family transcriptional regulator [Pseudalkalibacillus hwajinpoensis]
MLQQFGFTQYESQVYEALITIDEALDATAIVKRSSVPRSKVYDVLRRLSEKGMVLESTVEKKRLYTPLPLESAISKLRRDFNDNITQLKSIQARNKPADDRVWTLKDDQSIHSLVSAILNQASSSIVFSGWADDIEQHNALLENKENNGVSVEIHTIGNLNTQVKNVTTLIPDSEHQSLERSRIVIIDKEEVLFAGIEETSWQAIHTKSRPLVTFFTEFFYHDVALTEITQKFGSMMMNDPEIRNVLLKLRY